MRLPVFSGDGGVGEVVAVMRQPSYLRLVGKCLGGTLGVGLAVRRLPPQVAMPLVLVTGIYVGLEMAAWMEEEAKAAKGPVIDATAVEAPAGSELVEVVEPPAGQLEGQA